MECGDWENKTFRWEDYAVFATTLLVSLGIGIFYGFCAGGKQRTTSEFLMGNKQMNAVSLGISLSLGFTSAIAILGNAAEMYNYGTQYVTMILGFLVMVPFVVNLFLPVMRELAITSIYEYLDRRFNNGVRQLVVFIYLLMMLMYITVIVYAPALALRQVTGIDTMYAVGIIFTVAIMYSSLGGIKAVVWSDVFQTVVIMAALIMVIIRGTMKDGDPISIWQHAIDTDRIELLNFNTDPRERHTFWSTVVGMSFYWIGMNSCTQTFLQRLLSVPTQREALVAVWLSSIGMILIYLPTFYIGLMMYAHFQSCDPLLSETISASDQILPLYVMEVAGDLPGLPGLFVAGVFSASLSTVGSVLNAVSASMLRDLLHGGLGFSPPEHRAALVTRLLCALFGVLCFALTFLVSQLGGLLQVAISFNGMVVGVVLAIFTLGMYVPYSNTKGVLTGALMGLGVVLWLGMGTQVAVIQGRLSHTKKLIGINCDCNVTMPVRPPLDEVFDGFRLSYLWYSPIGWAVTLIAGTVASFLVDKEDYLRLDPALLAPIVRRWFIKTYKISSETKPVTPDAV